MASETAGQAAPAVKPPSLGDAGRRRRRWCHDHARSQRRPAGMDSSLPMLVPSSAIFTAARSRVWAHPTTCCAMSFDVRQQHVQRSETGRVSTVSECVGRYVSYINRLSRGMRWFKPEKATDRSVRSARVSRCSLRAADGARGEAWRPLTVSHGVSETGTIQYHHRVIHPGRGDS